MSLQEKKGKKYPYTLEEIREICGIDSIHTARKYLHDVLPPGYEKEGHGLGARYSENTLNSFRFVMMIKKSQESEKTQESKEKLKRALKLGQIRKVMEELGQEQINRMVLDNEPIDIRFVVAGKNGQISIPRDLKSALAKQTAVLISGDNAKTINKFGDGALQYSLTDEESYIAKQDEWNTYIVGEHIEVRYKGGLDEEQLDELKFASRILRSIIDR